jgi:hypothetical protein
MSIRFRAFVVVIGLAAVGCSPPAVASLLPAPASALVTVTTRGGECPEGPCGSTLVIEQGGVLRQTAPEDLVFGRVPADALATLSAAIRSADFGSIRSRPFTGECPVNYDGQEVIYEFGAPTGIEPVASCETEIDPDHPLFRAVQEALALGGAV